METEEAFNGNMAALIAGLLVCLPFGIYYYFANKEEMQICPSCRENADLAANKCPNCGEDL